MSGGWDDIEEINGRTCRVCKTWKPFGRINFAEYRCNQCKYRAYTPFTLAPGARVLMRSIVITPCGRAELQQMRAEERGAA